MKRYLTHSMLRQLLTLFALISGLGFAATPAVAAHASVVSVAAAGETEDRQAVVSGPLELVHNLSSRHAATQSGPSNPIFVTVPTVQIRVDRSRE